MQEALHQRGLQVGHETPREWTINQMWTSVDGVRHWLWRAADGLVLDVLLQRHQGSEDLLDWSPG